MKIVLQLDERFVINMALSPSTRPESTISDDSMGAERIKLQQSQFVQRCLKYGCFTVPWRKLCFVSFWFFQRNKWNWRFLHKMLSIKFAYEIEASQVKPHIKFQLVVVGFHILA